MKIHIFFNMKIIMFYIKITKNRNYETYPNETKRRLVGEQLAIKEQRNVVINHNEVENQGQT